MFLGIWIDICVQMCVCICIHIYRHECVFMYMYNINKCKPIVQTVLILQIQQLKCF